MSRRAGRRPGFLYELWGYDPRALLKGHIRIICLYVGQTRQKPETRWRQHQYGSPNGEPGKIWWPLVTDRRVTYRKLLVGNWKLDLREAMRIAKRAPVANIKLNRINTQRIPPYEMKRLMAQIERAGGVKALVAKADGRTRAVAGWSITPEGVVWYGSQADRVGARWLKQSTGFSSSLASPSEESPVSSMRRRASGTTAHARV